MQTQVLEPVPALVAQQALVVLVEHPEPAVPIWRSHLQLVVGCARPR